MYKDLLALIFFLAIGALLLWIVKRKPKDPLVNRRDMDRYAERHRERNPWHDDK